MDQFIISTTLHRFLIVYSFLSISNLIISKILVILSQASQKKKGATSCSSIVNVRCNPRDVIFTTGLLNPQQYAEADGFAELLRMKTDAASS
jgi:hypothetical protein